MMILAASLLPVIINNVQSWHVYASHSDLYESCKQRLYRNNYFTIASRSRGSLFTPLSPSSSPLFLIRKQLQNLTPYIIRCRQNEVEVLIHKYIVPILGKACDLRMV